MKVLFPSPWWPFFFKKWVEAAEVGNVFFFEAENVIGPFFVFLPSKTGSLLIC